MRHGAWSWACLAALAASTAARAQDDLTLASRARADLTQPAEERPDAFTARLDDPPSVAPAFGSLDSTWLTLGALVAHDFDHAVDVNLHAAYTNFFVKDLEFTLELAAWHFQQDGDNALGLSPSMVFRYHFYNDGRWTAFGDIGIGVLFASDNTPDGGTTFNLMPRFGVGFTRQLDDLGRRLEVGLRWHHISNARIEGDEDNPARDAPALYFGIVIPL